MGKRAFFDDPNAPVGSLPGLLIGSFGCLRPKAPAARKPPAICRKPTKQPLITIIRLATCTRNWRPPTAIAANTSARPRRAYRAALKADPSATFIAEELSDLYIQSGRLREAVLDAEDALKQNPNDLNSRRLLARIYTHLIGDSQTNQIDPDMVKKAIEQYQKITETDPKDVDSWIMLGRLQKALQNSTEAMAAYKKALELDAGNEDAMTGLATVYADLGDNKAAADMLQKVADKDPNPRSLTSLASVYEQLKDYSLAAEMLRRALDQQPGNSDLKHGLAEDLLLSDQLDDALKLYQESVAEDPKDDQGRCCESRRSTGKSRISPRLAKPPTKPRRSRPTIWKSSSTTSTCWKPKARFRMPSRL
jgi:tetratricopeptide (TPR) repeat protein